MLIFKTKMRSNKLQITNFKKNTGLTQAPNGSAGFTLIEASIAIAVLLIGLLAVIQLFPFAFKIIGDSQNTAIASNITLSKIEEMRSNSYDDISIGTVEVKQRISVDTASYLYKFQRETIVEYVDSDFNSSMSDLGLKKITVTTFWPSPLSLDEKSVKINLMLADY